MKRLTYVVAIWALGTAHAAREFPYYPEFADEFSKVAGARRGQLVRNAIGGREVL